MNDATEPRGILIQDGRAIGQPSLFDVPVTDHGPGEGVPLEAPQDPDATARAYAVDPRSNVVLEASAGTGKTSVLVARYVNLLKAGVDPANILAITFTRKAAAEMRERILRELRLSAERSELGSARSAELRERLSDVAISTIDAFCLSLLREFPLEAGVDPGFDLADETEVPRLVATALDRAMRILVAVARTDVDVALVLAQLGIARTREGLAILLERRLVAAGALDRFLARGPRELAAATICAGSACRLLDVLRTVPGGLGAFLADGPAAHPRYQLFLREVRKLPALQQAGDADVRAALDRIAAHFLTLDGRARKAGTIPPYRAEHYPSREAAARHREAVFAVAPRVEEVVLAFARDLNVVLARGIRRMFRIALEQYRRALEERSVLDFADVLERALDLLRQMDEFSQSRFRLESRYHHVLVDEFQDTSRAQWELVSLLVQSWREGMGVAVNPSIFVVGDRKQSIYRFRDAEVGILEEAAGFIEALRPDSRARRSIVRSFRAAPELLRFVNDVFTEMSGPAGSSGAFIYDERDRFPLEPSADPSREARLGVAVGESPEACASAVADEVARLLAEGRVRDKGTGIAREIRPGDIGILFRSRSSHREFERELNARGIPTYVYKGLGFFDADEIKDLTSLIRYLADPVSELRTAAFLRSRFVRVSDRALALLAPGLSSALLDGPPPHVHSRLEDEDRRVLEHARRDVRRWLALADRVTPAELIDGILSSTAYAFELGGPRRRQAWENVKKMRSLVRRIQNRGYATLPRLAEHLDSLSAGDESNAVVEALDAVNLMTIHASKGLEFPVVFVVNLARGASAPPRPVRVAVDPEGEPSITVGPFISDTDEAERGRECHETRRLLYVAVTRARDHLYLATTLKEGCLVPGRGSLAEVMPASLKGLFNEAASAPEGSEMMPWTGASGRHYVWRLCRSKMACVSLPSLQAGKPTREQRTADAADFGPPDEFGPPVAAPSRVRIPATELARGSSPEPFGSGLPQSERLLGTIVHRLFQVEDGVMTTDAGERRVRELIVRLLRPDERAALLDLDAFAALAARRWLDARARPDVQLAFAGLSRSYEIPFSMRDDDGGRARVVRGTIDLVVRKGERHVAVVELKTGTPHPAHERQLELYLKAAQALYPQDRVEGILLYV